MSSTFTSLSLPRILFGIVFRLTMNAPFLAFPHMCVNPRKSKVPGFAVKGADTLWRVFPTATLRVGDLGLFYLESYVIRSSYSAIEAVVGANAVLTGVIPRVDVAAGTSIVPTSMIGIGPDTLYPQLSLKIAASDFVTVPVAGMMSATGDGWGVRAGAEFSF